MVQLLRACKLSSAASPFSLQCYVETRRDMMHYLIIYDDDDEQSSVDGMLACYSARVERKHVT